jgi:hypothetical protein
MKLLMHSSTSFFRSWMKPASAARLIARRKAFSCARSESFRATSASELFRNCGRQRELVGESGKGEPFQRLNTHFDALIRVGIVVSFELGVDDVD